MTLMRVKRKGKNHPSSNWIRAVFGYWYPATEQLYELRGIKKIRIKYTIAMRDWLLSLQRFAVSPAKAIEIFDIGQGLFNLDGNSAYRKLRWPAKNRIPIVGKLKPLPIAQGITSDGNVVNVLRKEGKWAIIECIDPKKSLPTNKTPRTHPHLFCRFSAVQVGTGRYAWAVGGAIFPLYGTKGQARMLLSDLEKI